jgi:hypothetical protein
MKILQYFGAFMALVYVALGLYLLIAPFFGIVISIPYPYMIGGLLIGYGGLRAYRVFKNIQVQKAENLEEQNQ